jgi:hypothetical protein
MPESETLVVFRILAVLAKARDLGQALPVERVRTPHISVGRTRSAI